MTSPLLDLFLRIVKIDAPSKHELPMAAFVKESLAEFPVKVIMDSSAVKFGGNCGNLICLPAHYHSNEPAIALFAHLDTPRSTRGVRPLVAEGRISSDGSTILGVDNRAGVSVLLDLLQQIHLHDSKGNIIIVFTVAEEAGLFGSMHVDLTPYNISMGFVFDCSKRPGIFIRSAVGCSLFDVQFIGRAAHAAVAPERGVNAIRMAAKAMASVPVGRLSQTLTANMGLISGGEATNTVPDRCTVHGEVRSFDPSEIRDQMEKIRSICQSAADDCGGRVLFEVNKDFEPFVLSSESNIMKHTTAILQSVGLDPRPIDYLGGSDANMLNAKGIPTVNLGIGAQNPHANEEFILIEDLLKASEIAFALAG